MSAQSDEPRFGAETTAPAAARPTRPFYWSVRRELWENRFLYFAPLIAAGVLLLAFTVSAARLPERMRDMATLDPPQQVMRVSLSYSIVATALIGGILLAALFYCLSALHGERRDRSLLFWKSLPVSDRTTVLAKASIPLVVLPAIAAVVVVATHLAMLLLSSGFLLAGGIGVGPLWEQVNLPERTLVLLYGLVVMSLWHAPVYAWLLLVSGWARSAAFLWAVLPVLALGAVEKLAVGTSFVLRALKSRLIGFMDEAFVVSNVHDSGSTADAVMRIPHLDPARFLTSPGMWIGLAVAVAFLAMAVRQRRRREPV